MVPQGRLQWYPYFWSVIWFPIYEVSRHLWAMGTMQVIPVSSLRRHPLVSKSGPSLCCLPLICFEKSRGSSFVQRDTAAHRQTGPRSRKQHRWPCRPVCWSLKWGQEGNHFPPRSKHLSSFLSTQREHSTSTWDPRRHPQYMKTLPRKERLTS